VKYSTVEAYRTPHHTTTSTWAGRIKDHNVKKKDALVSSKKRTVTLFTVLHQACSRAILNKTHACMHLRTYAHTNTQDSAGLAGIAANRGPILAWMQIK
jgi:hypothetical protein